MKIAPVSADLLIKIAIGAAAVGLVWYGYKRVTGAAGDAFASVSSAAGNAVDAAIETASTSLNPASDQNLIYRGVNAVGGSVSGDQSWSLGGWLYDITHPEPVQPPASTPAGHTAYWKS